MQISLEDFQRFASLRRHMKELTVALMFFHQTTGSFTMSDFKVSLPYALSLGHVHRCSCCVTSSWLPE